MFRLFTKLKSQSCSNTVPITHRHKLESLDILIMPYHIMAHRCWHNKGHIPSLFWHSGNTGTPLSNKIPASLETLTKLWNGILTSARHHCSMAYHWYDILVSSVWHQHVIGVICVSSVWCQGPNHCMKQNPTIVAWKMSPGWTEQRVVTFSKNSKYLTKYFVVHFVLKLCMSHVLQNLKQESLHWAAQSYTSGILQCL